MNNLSSKRFIVCLDICESLHEWLLERIKDSGRSLEDEIISLLVICSKKKPEDPVATTLNVIHHLMNHSRKMKQRSMIKKSKITKTSTKNTKLKKYSK